MTFSHDVWYMKTPNAVWTLSSLLIQDLSSLNIMTAFKYDGLMHLDKDEFINGKHFSISVLRWCTWWRTLCTLSCGRADFPPCCFRTDLAQECFAWLSGSFLRGPFFFISAEFELFIFLWCTPFFRVSSSTDSIAFYLPSFLHQNTDVHIWDNSSQMTSNSASADLTPDQNHLKAQVKKYTYYDLYISFHYQLFPPFSQGQW